jgi:hypothetical protein
MKQVHLYGGNLDNGQCVTVDHCVQTFTVTVRSMSGVSAQQIKDLIQKRHEVTHVEEGEGTQYVL